MITGNGAIRMLNRVLKRECDKKILQFKCQKVMCFHVVRNFILINAVIIVEGGSYQPCTTSGKLTQRLLRHQPRFTHGFHAVSLRPRFVTLSRYSTSPFDRYGALTRCLYGMDQSFHQLPAGWKNQLCPVKI